jgi:hypothetical protein
VISFERDIKRLFRSGDREFMLYVFDLWELDDVKADAANILDRVKDGTMPCDQPWSPDQMARFEGWIEGGYQP